MLTIQGSYFISFAGVFRTSSIELVPTIIGIGDLLFDDDSQDQLVLQPKTIPSIDDDFTFGGKCTTTNGKTLTQIISHSCFYDLCLGSPTDCVNIYAGTRFNFSPIKIESNRGYFVGLQNNGNLNPEEGVSRDDDSDRSLQTNSKKEGIFRNRGRSLQSNSKKRVVRGDITKNEAPVSNTTPQTNSPGNMAGSRKLQNQLVVPFRGKNFQRFDGSALAKNGRFPLPPSFPGYVRVVVSLLLVLLRLLSNVFSFFVSLTMTLLTDKHNITKQNKVSVLEGQADTMELNVHLI